MLEREYISISYRTSARRPTSFTISVLSPMEPPAERVRVRCACVPLRKETRSCHENEAYGLHSHYPYLAFSRESGIVGEIGDLIHAVHGSGSSSRDA